MFLTLTLRAGGTIYIREDAVVSIYPEPDGCSIRIGAGEVYYVVSESADKVLDMFL